MKKLALILALVLMLAACGTTAPETTVPTTTAPETTAPVETTTPAETEPEVLETEPEFVMTETQEKLDALYQAVPVELALMTETMEMALADDEMFTYLTTLTSKEGVVDASVSLPMMGAQAYHVVLVKAESAEKAGEIAQFMFDNMDMARWVCVQATEKQAVVCGDLAFFVMLDPQYGVTCDQLVEGFTGLCEGEVTIIK
ncbi:MAG: hypothetical protein IKD27_05860 [Oscillospiraceae bacterium]|nr:hypothetical protein [Oscillospiraceae bacterium]